MQDLTTFISNHAMLSVAAAILIILVLILEWMRARQGSFSVSTQGMTQMINHDHATVIDIRPADLYKKGHVIDALSMAASDVLQPSKKLDKLKNKPLIIVCGTGSESQKIAALLIKQGYNAFSLAGGMRAWSEAQMPLIKE